MDSIGVQEEDRESVSAIVTGMEQMEAHTGDSQAQKRLPAELEQKLQDSSDHFKTKAMEAMNEFVCAEPGLNPLVSVAETDGKTPPSIQIFMAIFTLALSTMTSQMNTVKQWYRSLDEEELQGDAQRALNDVTAELRDAREELQRMREENDQLMTEQQPLSADHHSLGSGQHHSPPLEEPLSPPTSLAQNTQGYVRVEKQATAEDGSVKFRVEDVSQRESDLERKIAKLKSTQKQLVEANTEWERHSRELNEQHEKHIKSLKDELRNQQEREQQKYTDRLDEYKQQYESKLTSISEELTRKEAAYQSLRERQHHNEAAVQLKPVVTTATRATSDGNLSKRVEELELQVQDLRHERSRTQQQPHGAAPLNLNTENRQTNPGVSRSTVDNLNSKIRHYKQQVSLLQAQITTFKEDFDNEKADKERAKALKLEAQQQLQRTTAEVADLKRLVTQKDRESDAVRNQSDYVRQQYTQKCRELDSERSKHKDCDSKISRLQSKLRQQQQQQAVHDHQLVNISRPPAASALHNPAVWQCPHCTYENIHPRVFCEICGLKSPHALPSDNFGSDNTRLLARNIEQPDGDTGRSASSRKYTTASRTKYPYHMRDIEQDTQFIETDCI